MFLPGKRQQLLLPLLFLLSADLLFSQEISPYSRFGLGEPASPAFSASRGMGRLAAAHRDPFYINIQNPASYSNLSLTTLEAGFRFTTKNILDGQTQQSYRSGDAFLDYLAFGFPGGKKAGVSFGVTPYSEMNYNFSSNRNYDTLQTNRQLEGNGRLYRLYAGFGYRTPASDTSKHVFSFGMNFSYIFGNLERSDILNIPGPGYLPTRYFSSTRVNNIALNPGVQYKVKLNDTLTFIIGAYSNFPVAVKSNETQVWDRRIVSGNSAVTDTILLKNTDNENIRIPVDACFGVSIGKTNKWLAGVDAVYYIWNKVEPFSPDVKLQNAVELRIGGEFRPNFRSQNLIKNSAYRIGGYLNNGYLEIDGERIMDYGLSFGWSMPLKTAFSRLNFSFEVGSKGTTQQGLVRETYFRSYIGLTLNDKWFVKPKYD